MTIKFDGLTMNQLAERNAELHMNLSALTVENTELQGKLKRAESAVAIGLESMSHSLHVLRVETARSNQLAVENATLKETLESVINPDNEPEYHDQGMGCGVEDRGLQRDGYEACAYGWESAMERVYSEVIPSSMPATPITDAAIAEIYSRAIESVVPAGFVVVPERIELPAESMEGICFHCGDGEHKFGAFTDGILFIGEVENDDGSKVYGIHIATADYPEEGCATICEFAQQLCKESGHE